MLTQTELLRIARYDPRTGVFHSTVQRGRVKVGDIMGHNAKKTGYGLIGISGQKYGTHRLAWLYMTGTFPTVGVDHINGDTSDNRFCNLRLATQQQNMLNTACRRDSSSGIKGVYHIKQTGRWAAKTRVSKTTYYIGSFASKEEAAHAYKTFVRPHYEEFVRV